MLDVAFVAWRRFREGRKLTSGDRTHLHHLLLAAGLSQRTILAVYLGVATVFGITTLIFASWQKMIALGILVLLSGLAVSWLYKKYSREKYERTI
jgi:hypothetical protein